MIIKYNEYIKESNDSYFFQTYEETKNWLDNMKIYKYTINDDLTVDVDSTVSISNKKLTIIPVQFKEIHGNFYCSNNILTNLKGCPKIIKYGSLYCHDNSLEDINDLDSKILIKCIKNKYYWVQQISTKLYDNYFEHWITKDINIVSALKDKVSDKIKEKYKHLFNAKNFDLL